MARYKALGMVETFGLVFALEAADAMCKSADVELIGYENVASGYISVLV
ncbi:BMC domain-containing protein, partial [Porphyromonas levii]